MDLKQQVRLLKVFARDQAEAIRQKDRGVADLLMSFNERLEKLEETK